MRKTGDEGENNGTGGSGMECGTNYKKGSLRGG